MYKVIAVIGNSVPLEEYETIAYELGGLIAERNWVLMTGGLGGVMEKACKGAKEKKGLTIGILPGADKKEANKYVDIPVITAMQQARNAIIVRSADVIVAVGGGLGTLSEIAMALKINKPVITVSSWDVDDKLIKAHDAQSAVDEIEKILSKK